MRRALLEERMAGHSDGHARLSPVGPSNEETHLRMLELGLEGSVCKRRDSRYVSGGRGQSWVKIKPQETCEAKIVGFKDGTGSNAGMVGAFKIELETGAETTCKVLTNQLRAAVTENPQSFLGRTIEVKHHGVQATGKVRHPQFLRFRDDKDNLTPRERQVAAALIASAEAPRTRERQVRQMTRPAQRRMRNYQAMGDAKLLKVRDELLYEGDAYSRAVESGSGNPAADLAVVQGLLRERGLG